MGARQLPPVQSANVVGEMPGGTEEIVLPGAHRDSRDVGTGAHDDGAGCMTVIEAARLIRRFGGEPGRTIRVVLFTNEENGPAGAGAYRDTHRGELAKHAAALEADSGGAAPVGLGVTVSEGRDSEQAIRRLEPL